MFKGLKTYFKNYTWVGNFKNRLAKTVALASFLMILVIGPILGGIHGFKHDFGAISAKITQNSVFLDDFGGKNNDSHSIFSCSACVFNGFSHNLIAVDAIFIAFLAISLVFLGRAFDLSRTYYLLHSFSSRAPPRR